MIPHGLNPHGLEDRVLTFSVLENNNPAYVTYSNNRLYCWATFPSALGRWLNSNYGIPLNSIDLSVEQAPDEASWNALTKYKSKEISGRHFMIQDNWDDVNKKYINGNQTFYYQVWVQSAVPDFATIYVLDISGSMSGDKERVKCGMTGEIYNYNTFPDSAQDSRIYVYSAAMLTSMTVDESVLGQIKFGRATSKEIWEAVDPFVTDAMKKTSGSECMITNMYYSIANFLKRVFEGDKAEAIGRNCHLSAATFLMFTDEDIFTSDTLNAESELSKSGGSYYHEWYKNWQTHATNPFPTEFTSGADNRRNFCMSITKALRQMSYYYGVNFTWGLYDGLCPASNRGQLLPIVNSRTGQVTSPGTGLLMSKCTVGSKADGYPIKYSDGVAWTIPNTFPIVQPHEPMCRIQLYVPLDFIDTSKGSQALKSDRVMKKNDQYTESTIFYKFHKEKDSNNEYCAFRYKPNGKSFSEQPVTLPRQDDMNIKTEEPPPEGSPEGTPGQTYTYHWETYNLKPGKSVRTVACGGSYLPNANDLAAGVPVNKPAILFRLVRDM